MGGLPEGDGSSPPRGPEGVSLAVASKRATEGSGGVSDIAGMEQVLAAGRGGDMGG